MKLLSSCRHVGLVHRLLRAQIASDLGWRTDVVIGRLKIVGVGLES